MYLKMKTWWQKTISLTIVIYAPLLIIISFFIKEEIAVYGEYYNMPMWYIKSLSVLLFIVFILNMLLSYIIHKLKNSRKILQISTLIIIGFIYIFVYWIIIHIGFIPMTLCNISAPC